LFLEVEALPDHSSLPVQVLLLWNCLYHSWVIVYWKPCYHKLHTAFCGFL
jgi:hypothetical protein